MPPIRRNLEHIPYRVPPFPWFIEEIKIIRRRATHATHAKISLLHNYCKYKARACKTQLSSIIFQVALSCIIFETNLDTISSVYNSNVRWF